MKKDNAVLDYAESGLDIQYAMIDHAKRFPSKEKRPQYIIWNSRPIWTSDRMPVPKRGIVRAEFLSVNSHVRQGFDLKFDGGWVELAAGQHIPLLRTWKDEEHEDHVEYPFFSPDGLLWVWNVYEMTYRGGQTVEERWTANAGLWVEKNSETERTYHCSNGMDNPPDFESLVFRVSVMPAQSE